MRRLVATCTLLLSACSNESFADPPAGASQIAVNSPDIPARYYLLEQEKAPSGRINAIVLQQFKNGRPGERFGYEVECGAGGARWATSTAGTLAELRAKPSAEDRFQLGEPGSESAQIATWLCG